MKNKYPPEKIKIQRFPELGNLELLHAKYFRQNFARHSHDYFAVGVIESGALGFYYRGENIVAPAGTINLANPDEAHTGHAMNEEGWSYRMLYMDAELLRKAALETAGRNAELPFFQKGVLEDHRLAEMIVNLHRDMTDEHISRLERESRLLAMLSSLILRHADAPPSLCRIGRERKAVRRVKEYIRAYYSLDLSVDELAGVACLSPFHFIRVFAKECGLPPHTYLIQERIRQARKRIAKGWTISAAALESGFADQSHLTRHFKRIVGITPGRYRRNLLHDTGPGFSGDIV